MVVVLVEWLLSGGQVAAVVAVVVAVECQWRTSGSGCVFSWVTPPVSHMYNTHNLQHT